MEYDATIPHRSIDPALAGALLTSAIGVGLAQSVRTDGLIVWKPFVRPTAVRQILLDERKSPAEQSSHDESHALIAANQARVAQSPSQSWKREVIRPDDRWTALGIESRY
jgi:hypothetical protein